MKFLEISEIEQEEGFLINYFFLKIHQKRMKKFKETFILKKGGGRYRAGCMNSFFNSWFFF